MDPPLDERKHIFWHGSVLPLMRIKRPATRRKRRTIWSSAKERPQTRP